MKQGTIIRKGTDASGNEINRKYIDSKLISIGSNKLTNTNGTEYRVGTIHAITAQGELKTFSSQIWEKNVERLTVGEEYLTEVRVDNGVVYLNTSSMTAAERATVADFAFEDEAPVAATQAAPTAADLV